MKRKPSLAQGLVIAAALALLAAIALPALTTLYGLETAIRLAAPLLGLAYILHFMHATQARTGRLTTIGAWFVLAICAWWLVPTLPVYLLVHAGAIWIARGLFAYTGIVPALVDGVLSIFAVMAFTWAFTRTGSVFVATWSFFIVHALWICIPQSMNPRQDQSGQNQSRQATSPDTFERARRQADAALRQLFNE